MRCILRYVEAYKLSVNKSKNGYKSALFYATNINVYFFYSKKNYSLKNVTLHSIIYISSTSGVRVALRL